MFVWHVLYCYVILHCSSKPLKVNILIELFYGGQGVKFLTKIKERGYMVIIEIWNHSLYWYLSKFPISEGGLRGGLLTWILRKRKERGNFTENFLSIMWNRAKKWLRDHINLFFSFAFLVHLYKLTVCQKLFKLGPLQYLVYLVPVLDLLWQRLRVYLHLLALKRHGWNTQEFLSLIQLLREIRKQKICRKTKFRIWAHKFKHVYLPVNMCLHTKKISKTTYINTL